MVNTTSSKVEQDPLLIVHLNVTLFPDDKLVIVVEGELILVITDPFAAPCIVHTPAPGPATFPPRVKVPVLHCS